MASIWVRWLMVGPVERLAKEHPILTARDGRHCIDVFEIVDLEV